MISHWGLFLAFKNREARSERAMRSCIPVHGRRTSSSRPCTGWKAPAVKTRSLGLPASGNPCRFYVGTGTLLHPHCRLRIQLLL